MPCRVVFIGLFEAYQPVTSVPLPCWLLGYKLDWFLLWWRTTSTHDVCVGVIEAQLATNIPYLREPGVLLLHEPADRFSHNSGKRPDSRATVACQVLYISTARHMCAFPSHGAISYSYSSGRCELTLSNLQWMHSISTDHTLSVAVRTQPIT